MSGEAANTPKPKGKSPQKRARQHLGEEQAVPIYPDLLSASEKALRRNTYECRLLTNLIVNLEEAGRLYESEKPEWLENINLASLQTFSRSVASKTRSELDFFQTLLKSNGGRV